LRTGQQLLTESTVCEKNSKEGKKGNLKEPERSSGVDAGKETEEKGRVNPRLETVP